MNVTIGSANPVPDSNLPAASGNAFVRACSGIDKDGKDVTSLEVIHQVACVAYIAGFMDGVDTEIAFAELKASTKPPAPYNRPHHLEHGQIVRIVLKYIKDHPEAAHLPTAALAVGALEEAFPTMNTPAQ